MQLDVAGDGLDLGRHDVGGDGRDRRDADRVLRGDGGDGARAVDAERRERLQVGLDARAAARIAAGNRQDGPHRRVTATARIGEVSLPKTSR